jgi:integrase/recombinase XerD
MRILSKYEAMRADTRVYGRSDCEQFFRNRTGHALTPEALTQIIRRIGKGAGIKLYPHLLRHTFCTHFMANDGADVLSLQSIAGWSTIAMADRYAKSQLPKLKRSMESFSPANNL